MQGIQDHYVIVLDEALGELGADETGPAGD
jgi:hypothetical protein